MDAPTDAFGPIDRPDQVALRAVDPGAVDPTPILTSQQGADPAHVNLPTVARGATR